MECCNGLKVRSITTELLNWLQFVLHIKVNIFNELYYFYSVFYILLHIYDAK